MIALLQFLKEHPSLSVFASAMIGFVGALFAISTQRAINRRRATVDMLTSKMWDQDYIKSSRIFYQMLKDQKTLMQQYDLFVEGRNMKHTGAWSKLREDDKKVYDDAYEMISHVRFILNDRELVAIGIREGTYDEPIFRRWWYTTYIQEWRESSAIVARIRSDAQVSAAANAYAEFDALAKRWQAEGPWSKSDRHFRLPGGRFVTLSRSR